MGSWSDALKQNHQIIPPFKVENVILQIKGTATKLLAPKNMLACIFFYFVEFPPQKSYRTVLLLFKIFKKI